MEVVHKKKNPNVFLLKLLGQEPQGVGMRAAGVLAWH